MMQRTLRDTAPDSRAYELLSEICYRGAPKSAQDGRFLGD